MGARVVERDGARPNRVAVTAMAVRSATDPPLARELFAREDETADADFYAEPRFALHVDEATIAALTELYREELRPGSPAARPDVARGSRTCRRRSPTRGSQVWA